MRLSLLILGTWRSSGWAGISGCISQAASSALTACRGSVRQAASWSGAHWLFAKDFGVSGEIWEKASSEEDNLGTSEDEATTVGSGKDFRNLTGEVMSKAGLKSTHVATSSLCDLLPSCHNLYQTFWLCNSLACCRKLLACLAQYRCGNTVVFF